MLSITFWRDMCAGKNYTHVSSLLPEKCVKKFMISFRNMIEKTLMRILFLVNFAIFSILIHHIKDKSMKKRNKKFYRLYTSYKFYILDIYKVYHKKFNLISIFH